MKKSLLILAVTIAGLVACKKETDMGGPAVTILSPSSGEMLTSGDSVLIEITAEDEDMHEMEWKVVEAADTSHIYFQDGVHSHDVDVHYSQKFLLPSVLAHTNVILYVHAEDHNDNSTDKSVSFSIMP